ncbi:MAG: hypothetical protein DBY00_04420 [Flavobacteriales bacterium]|nr:MAG: hypothetical protein DBY00_04420 [Flavobacteriales bacterium]
MNEYAFEVIKNINLELTTGAWGLVKDVDNTATCLGTDEDVALPGHWAYFYVDKYMILPYLDDIEPTMVLPLSENRGGALRLYKLD